MSFDVRHSSTGILRRACDAVAGQLFEALEKRELLSASPPLFSATPTPSGHHAHHRHHMRHLHHVTHAAQAARMPQAAVVTDQLDYQPGQSALITGSAFLPGEQVRLQVLHTDGTPNTASKYQPWTVRADANGAFHASYPVGQDDLNTSLRLTVVGLTSNRQALENFTDSAPIVRADHIVIVIEEDRASGAIGDTVHMPYFNQLAAGGLVYTNSHGVAHPSLPDYLALYSGSTQGITDNGNNHTFTGPNLAKLFNSTLIAPGQYLSFGGFAESLPRDGDTTTRISNDPGDRTSPPDLYMRNYNPMAQFTDVGNRAGVALTNAQVNKTFAGFPTTGAGYASLPTVSFIIPNVLHNTHGSNEQAPFATDPSEYNFLRSSADTWLKSNLDGYLQWAKANNSLLIITTDEEEGDSHATDTLTTIVNGDPNLFVPGQNTNSVNHFNLVRTIEDMYGLAPLGSSAAAARLDTNALGQLSTNSQASTSTTLISSAPSAVFGQNVTFTATVIAAAGTPTGTVTFNDGATMLGTGVLNSSGIATFTASALAAASHSISAVFAGNANFATSASPSITQAVNQASTTTTVTAPSSVGLGQSVSFSATVASVAPSAATPAGTVQFQIDGANFGQPVTLVAGSAVSSSTNSLPAGNHTIAALYSGSAGFIAGAGSGTTQIVGQDATATALASAPNPSVVGQPVTFTATVTSAAGTPLGAITFFDGITTLGAAALNASGIATFTTSTLSVASHSIAAVYSGSATFAAGTSPALMHQVVQAATAITLTSAPNPSVFGQSVSLTATVTTIAPGVGTATGAVTFMDGAITLGAATLNASGVATLTTAALSVAPHSITAAYAGNANLTASVSAPLIHLVNAAATTTPVASSANPATVNQSITFTATVAAAAPGAGIPAGTVQFNLDGVNFGGPVPLINGSAISAATSFATAGTHTLSATYSGDLNFVAGAASTLTQTISALSNNNFANRATLTGTSITATANNATATKETGEPSHAGNVGGKSLWWTWTAPASGKVTIDTAGSSFDTLLAVYTGAAVSALTAVTGGSNDDVSGALSTSKVTFNITAGTVYQIAVDGYAAASGNITLHLNIAPAAPPAPTNVAASDGAFTDKVQVTWTAAPGATAYEVWRATTNNSASANKISATDVTTTTYDDATATPGATYYYWVKSKTATDISAFSASDPGKRLVINDAFASRITLSGKTVTATGSNIGATRETGEPNHAGNVGGKSVWWTWTAPTSGKVTIDTTGSTFDTLLAVYTGNSVSALTPVTGGSNDDASATLSTSKVSFNVTAGTVYQIAVDGYAAFAGNITLHINLV